MTALRLYDRPTAVYRLFAMNGDLLYVGCSCDPRFRIDYCHLYKPWGPDVADITTEWFDSRHPALKREAQAIADEGPLYNVRRTRPERIRAPKPTPEPSPGAPRWTFLEAAEQVDVPVEWLWDGAATGKLPHSCSARFSEDVWFDADDIRDLHIIFDLPPLGMQKQRTSALQSVYRRARLKRCSHAVA